MSDSYQLQLPTFESEIVATTNIASGIFNNAELGTFKDNMRAPIHQWFKYPAGYSYKFVTAGFELFNINPGDWVYDPFSGTGTTLICAKQAGINAYGVEAHSFVHWVANVKLYWEYDLQYLGKELEYILKDCRNFISRHIENVDLNSTFPDLIYKCYHPKDLSTLYLIREFIMNELADTHIKDFLKVALTDSLRGAASAGTGWPYVAPRKNREMTLKDALTVFRTTVRRMYADLQDVAGKSLHPCEIHNILGDSRNKQALADDQVKLALTSPPYLNNYDYADRTRLETYFWGITQTWKDITRQYRDKLMVAATTQIIRSQHQVESALSQEIKEAAPQIYEVVQQSVLDLAERRLQKAGKKDYDLMVALYFNDMFRVLKETYRVLKNGGHFCLVLGDSAPYSVHIQTEQLIGELGVSLGFSKFDYQELRKRGGKWKANPQRHKIPLREGIVILTK